MDHSQVQLLNPNNPIAMEIPALISLVGILLWLFTRKVNTPISWSLFVFFVITPHLARTSLGTYTGHASINEFIIMWLVYGGIFGGITWGFGKLYMDNTVGFNKEDQDENVYTSFEEWGDKTYQINNRFFVKAWEELEKNAVDKGIWAKALSASDGDENKANAIYIRLRVKQLASEL